MKRRTWVTATVLVAGAVAVAAAAGGSNAAPASGTIAAGVTYRWQPCSSAAARLEAPKPVTAGTLELRRGGKTTRVSLLDHGTQPSGAALPGAGPVSATLVLETPRIRITGPGGGAAERLPLGSHPVVDGHVSFSVGASEERNGHVNALIQLQRAARVAAATVPSQLPLVKAHVVDGPPGARPQTHFQAPDVIVVGQANGADAQWEPTPLAHEYGHFIIHTLKAEGPAGGDHDLGKSYPQDPSLAWNEGFAHAFSAIVLKEGQGLLFNDCQPYMNLASTPARPGLATNDDERYSQYNETRVGAVVYQLVKRLGGGERGLKRLLTALPTYHRNGHSVWTARDLRDLAAQQFERSGTDNTAIDRIFFAHRMSWTAHIGVGPAAAADPEFDRIEYAWATISIRVTGPGGFDCHTTTDIDATPTTFDGGAGALGEKRADGGLPFAGADDCYLVSSSGKVDWNNPRGIGGEQATIPFPYLAGGKHWSGEYAVYATYHCEFDPKNPPGIPAYCPTGIKVRIQPVNLVLLITTPSATQGVPITLSREVDTKVATFKADGHCHIGSFDCSV